MGHLRDFILSHVLCVHKIAVRSGLNDKGTVEIGYGINPGYEGKGLMTEAVTAVVNWAAEQPGVLSIEAETEPNNIASQRVLEKAGFIRSGISGAEGPRYIWKKRRG